MFQPCDVHARHGLTLHRNRFRIVLRIVGEPDGQIEGRADFSLKLRSLETHRTTSARTIRLEAQKRRRRAHGHRPTELIRAGFRTAGNREGLSLILQRPDDVAFEGCGNRDREGAALPFVVVVTATAAPATTGGGCARRGIARARWSRARWSGASGSSGAAPAGACRRRPDRLEPGRLTSVVFLR